jgi:hypothetical protein
MSLHSDFLLLSGQKIHFLLKERRKEGKKAGKTNIKEEEHKRNKEQKRKLKERKEN